MGHRTHWLQQNYNSPKCCHHFGEYLTKWIGFGSEWMRFLKAMVKWVDWGVTYIEFIYITRSRRVVITLQKSKQFSLNINLFIPKLSVIWFTVDDHCSEFKHYRQNHDQRYNARIENMLCNAAEHNFRCRAAKHNSDGNA